MCECAAQTMFLLIGCALVWEKSNSSGASALVREFVVKVLGGMIIFLTCVRIYTLRGFVDWTLALEFPAEESFRSCWVSEGPGSRDRGARQEMNCF
ncbi:hypothetical protein XENTR_v10022591 [Xenopus tropicalis]|nr:hypothetical protein XENTR_v10022591 [Xenopus tropicalis]